MALMDIVNLNADASCLPSNKWLRSLEGGKNSRLCRLLNNYVRNRRKVNIGLTGATIKDLSVFNPEALDLINAHPEIFQILARPFAHDLSPLRNHEGFQLNLEYGLKTIKEHLKNTVPAFLQNELMIRNQQIETLVEHGLQAIFIHPERYDETVQGIIPKSPFFCQGTHRSPILTIPITDNLTVPYLAYLHREEPPAAWTRILKGPGLKLIWRDAESALLFPGGVDFEGMLFEEEKADSVERLHLSEQWDFFWEEADRNSNRSLLKHFPQRKLAHWLSDFKMAWLVEELRAIEAAIDSQSPLIQKLWLMAINSDIPASSEKIAPRFKVHPDAFQVPKEDFVWEGVLADESASTVTLLRSDRHFEGEVYIDLLHRLLNGRMTETECCAYIAASPEAYLKKAYARVLR
ncbi:MAG: hypothetical protein HY609_00280 [Deltaproteobacteria bacterium]|nr:hypothetical protein [Deltaproteobacteria bacterium]MBI4223343.1 hypothetical protein [Deltaproteobacteria bacterium]